MAPIPFKKVVSVSSEDPMHPGSNLLHSGSGKKWLSAAGHRSRQNQVELELCKRARISTIDVGNFGSAFIEVRVGNSDSADYVTLLPQSTLRTVVESRGGRNKTKTISYKKDRLSATAVSQKWNRVQIICTQPFNHTEQFGLQYIALYSDINTNDLRTHQFLSPPHTPKLLLSPPTPSTPSHSNHLGKFPNLPSHRLKGNPPNKTPTRPLRDSNTKIKMEDEFEFSGIEKQSRLFKNAVSGKMAPGEASSNPILEKIMSERQKYQSKKDATPPCAGYRRKKLLQKELPKAEGNSDFAASYSKGGTSSNKDIAMAFSRIAAHDNDYEIGEEPEIKWGWGKSGGRRRKRVGHGDGGWLSKRRKLVDMVGECKKIIQMASGHGEEATCSHEAPECDHEADPLMKGSHSGCDCDSGGDGGESDSTVIYGYEDFVDETSDEPTVAESSFVECPICGVIFPEYAVEVHASSCGEGQTMVGGLAGVIVTE